MSSKNALQEHTQHFHFQLPVYQTWAVDVGVGFRSCVKFQVLNADDWWYVNGEPATSKKEAEKNAAANALVFKRQRFEQTWKSHH